MGGFDTSRSGFFQQIGDLWQYRELIRLLTIKDLKLRYRGSVLGFLWSLVNPLLMMAVYTLVFTVLLPSGLPQNCNPGAASSSDAQLQIAVQCKISSNYISFILIGILVWGYTASSISGGMSAILDNASIEKKIYFPREILPMSVVFAQLANLLLAMIPLFAVLILTGVKFNIYILLLPVIMLSHTLFLLGLALILSVFVLYFRDLRIIMEVFLQAWFFLSPVIYSMAQVFKDYTQIVYWLNPMASYIEAYRTIIFFGYTPELGFTLRTLLTGLFVFVVGYLFFARFRKKIGEML